ncbi:ROK family transcriptional regulator [Jiangella alba]|uniref:Sugar kinase of the NBD/HSP70 family, may contain an N-terminal HTH domain n=1 Tax=Jiangella alba TaxID=561176 RepID=A0A1H5PTY4_9ACTN|nr:ROK family protein [Jiangella alba]SEF16678.1 Sugar kinase of the NBD/HSP70 family, may contain an N-terminal HTH domain [Jiangella alba]
MAGTSPGWLLQLIRSRDGWTRRQLLAETGLSRMTLFERLDALFRAGLVYEAGPAGPTGGRPAALIRFADRGRVVLVLDLDHHTGRIAVTDLTGRSLRERELPLDIAGPPASVLASVCEVGASLLASGAGETLVGVGVALPGPVSPATGLLRPATVMPGWDGFPIAAVIGSHWPVPVLLENDARAHALGEAADRPGVTPLLAVKYAHGIGAGLVLDGALLRGFDGAAGDIGHIRVGGSGAASLSAAPSGAGPASLPASVSGTGAGAGPVCRCGRTGCLAAYASGYALLRRRGVTPSSSDDLAERLAGSADLRDAAGLLGRTLAGLVALVNPRTIVLGGALGRLPAVVDEVSAAVRADALDRLTSELEIVPSTAHHPAAAGMAALVTGHVYAPAAVDAAVAT